ncbi:dTDP-4-amino-4,6-dideoxygalactose transaminase [Sinosporangium album]|uniref:dTDP-4-amino-4,6-dideoxygalactose transaminase n=1 Tax=Sinosporangium album TaxID=504805 RepID=A0A1G7YQR6_9ACTN|nr:aminotransferase class I/II-fold pyridoxal phosphate-dependent enzyme [Sinosporangium album]SDG98902.1 dTDP-4-amino-4,6-dideoxygalactose transaminase [Sinosporangium album]
MPGPGYAFMDEHERDKVLEVLDYWREHRYDFDNPGSTSMVLRFENAAAERFDVPYCVPVNSGTSALLAALAGLGIGPGDEVIVPGYMFVASIGAIVHSGATPVLAEIDESLTLDPVDVRARVTERTRAIMAVHMLGAPSNLAALQEVADEYGLALIEDNAQATGGTYRGALLGTIGTVGTFSLNHFKVVTGMDGGFVLTSQERLFQRAHSFHDQGWFPHRQEVGEGDLMFGLNLRMSELNAAVALAQLEKLDSVLARTRAVKTRLLEGIPEQKGMRRRLLHDGDGECGTLAVFIFDSAESAASVGESFGCKTLIDSPKHYYGGLPALAALGRGERGPTPFRVPQESDLCQSYGKGALPKTDDILSRSIALSTGVSDSYLGAGNGVGPFSKEADIDRIAKEFTSVVAKVLG